MPGLRLDMDPTHQVQVSAAYPSIYPSPWWTLTHTPLSPSQPQVKHEDGDGNDNDFLNEVEGAGDGTYRPRPQLAEPGVLKRTLAHLMSKFRHTYGNYSVLNTSRGTG